VVPDAWFFRLTGIGAIGFLAATVFRSRWSGCLAMLGVLVYLAMKKAVAYPFSLTAFSVFPILLALTIDALERRPCDATFAWHSAPRR
jgi:hypothetical protein